MSCIECEVKEAVTFKEHVNCLYLMPKPNPDVIIQHYTSTFGAIVCVEVPKWWVFRLEDM